MTLPPMKPSAEERVGDAIWNAQGLVPLVETAYRDGFAAALAMLHDAPDAVLDAMRAAAAYRLDLPVGVEGERENAERLAEIRSHAKTIAVLCGEESDMALAAMAPRMEAHTEGEE